MSSKKGMGFSLDLGNGWRIQQEDRLNYKLMEGKRLVGYYGSVQAALLAVASHVRAGDASELLAAWRSLEQTIKNLAGQGEAVEPVGGQEIMFPKPATRQGDVSAAIDDADKANE